MARLFTCGFEEDNFLETMWYETGGSPSRVTSPVHSGTYALQLAGAATAPYVGRRLSANITSGTVWLQFYFRKSVLGASDLLHIRAYDGTWAFGINVTAGDRMDINGLVSGTAPIAADTIYRVAIEWAPSASSTVTLRLNGTQDAQLAAQNIPNFGQFIFYNGKGAGGPTITIDDVILNDSTGSAPFNTWPGDSKIVLAMPASDVSMQWEDADIGVSSYVNVNDVPGTPVDSAHNKENDTLDQIDRMGITALPAEVPSGATMIAMDVYMRVFTDVSICHSQYHIWNESSALTIGPTMTHEVGAWKIPSIGPTNEHQVYDLSGKSKANVGAFNVGYKNITDSATLLRAVSALWANVEWASADVTPINVPLTESLIYG